MKTIRSNFHVIFKNPRVATVISEVLNVISEIFAFCEVLNELICSGVLRSGDNAGVDGIEKLEEKETGGKVDIDCGHEGSVTRWY